MPILKPGTILPTPEEDDAINAGIAADTDARELNKAWFKTARPAKEVLALGSDFLRKFNLSTKTGKPK